MTKKDIAQKIMEKHPKITKENAYMIVDLIIERIIETIKEGKRAEFRGFGSFSRRIRKPYQAKSVNSSEIVLFKKRILPYFRPSGNLIKFINKNKLENICK